MVESLEFRINRLEAEHADLERLWRSSVDDIKNTIKGEIAELKSEQIKDLRDVIKEHSERLNAHSDRFSHLKEQMDEEIRKIEFKVNRWETSVGVVHWIVRAIFAVIGLGAGFWGADHFRH
jgi:gas vesicle protein